MFAALTHVPVNTALHAKLPPSTLQARYYTLSQYPGRWPDTNVTRATDCPPGTRVVLWRGGSGLAEHFAVPLTFAP